MWMSHATFTLILVIYLLSIYIMLDSRSVCVGLYVVNHSWDSFPWPGSIFYQQQYSFYSYIMYRTLMLIVDKVEIPSMSYAPVWWNVLANAIACFTISVCVPIPAQDLNNSVLIVNIT